MLALDADTVKTAAIVVLVALVVSALVVAKVMRSIAQKVIGVVILVALAVAIWTQRAALDDCVDRIQTGDATTCTFFGYEVEVDLPDV